MPLFSLIITCYKQEGFIRETVESALAIPYADREIIVVDDASPDRSLEILNSYAGRIRLLKNDRNHGACYSRNEGARAATGTYLVFLDGDDLFLPWALELFSRIIALKSPMVILGRMLFFQGTAPRPEFSSHGPAIEVVEYDMLMRKDYRYRGSASAIVIHRDVFFAVGGFTDNMFPTEIDDLLVKLGWVGRTVQILSHPSTAYRLHDNNTIRQIGRFMDGMVTIVRKQQRGEYPCPAGGRYDNYSLIGGPVYYWLTKGIGIREFRRAAKLLAAGWLIIAVAIWARLLLQLKGRRKTELITLETGRD